MSDVEDLATLVGLQSEARRIAKTDFLSKYIAAALTLRATKKFPSLRPLAGPVPGPEEERSFKRTIASEESSVARTYDGRVAFLSKRPGNPFPNMITLGRAMNNDVMIALGTISKVHGFFWSEGGRWSFTDHKSTNGTTLNGARLAPGERKALSDGDELGLGLEIVATFLTPAALYDRLRNGL